ncbi:hypothetical protein GCM10028777_28650 [Angustibacter speluncae]
MTTNHRRRARLRGGAAAAVLALGLLAGCSAGSDTASGGDASVEAPAQAPDEGGGAGGSAGGGTTEDSDGGAGDAGEEVDVAERKVTRSQVTVEVEDLAAAATRVRELAAEAGGEVADESLNLDEDGFYDQGYYGQEQYGGSYGSDDPALQQPRVQAGPGEAVLVLRVPPDAAGSTVDAAAGLGEEQGRWTSSTSVETTLVDLETRIESQTRAVEQAQALLARAQDLDDVVMLENEVNRRTADLESLEARRASVQEQVDRATVTVVLRLPGGAPPEDRAGFLGGLEAGWDALVSSGAVLLVVVGALLPWAVLAALVGVPLWWWLRRRRARRPARPVGPFGPSGFGPPGPPPGAPAGPPAAPPAEGA